MTAPARPRTYPRSFRTGRVVRQRLAAGGGALALIAGVLAGGTASAQAAGSSTVWGSGTLTPTELASLVGQMTPAEEVSMLHGYGVHRRHRPRSPA